MHIREATKEDKASWDAFNDSEGGLFYNYFDWKYFFEARGDQYIPLVVEDDAFQLVGILPVVKEKRLLYSVLRSDTRVGGLLLKRDLSEKKKNEIISAISHYVDANYSDGCSRLILRENLSSINQVNEQPTAALLNSGFRFRYDMTNQLPCTFILELKQPFRDNIWRSLWTHSLRNNIIRVEGRGVVIIQDRVFHYVEDFIKMLSANYKRHGVPPLTRKQVMAALDKFRDKARLYVGLLNSQPIVTQISFYHSSVCSLWEVGSYVKNIKNANVLCFKKVIEDACNEGYKYVEFGYTGTPGLAIFKSHFHGTRVPLRIYEKRYSLPRIIMEFGSLGLDRTWRDKSYLWKQRHIWWNTITRR